MLGFSQQAKAQTVAEIKAKGTLVVGVQAENNPWGFVDAKGQPAGYDVDVAKLMAADMGVKLELVTVTIANRIAQLTTGKVNVLAAVMGMYPDRAKVIQFSKPYSVLNIVVLGKKELKIKNYADLMGTSLGTSRASAMDIALSKALPPGTPIQRFDNDTAAMQALLSGQADVIGSPGSAMANIKKIAGPDKYDVKFNISQQFNGLTVRLGQKDFVDWINGFIDRNIANGKLNDLNMTWFAEPLPEMPKEVAGVPFTVQ
jgi:polar amino acid transport system substrate-binding protein